MPRPAAKKKIDGADAESSMKINIHAEGGTTIPIILSLEKCTSTTWGALCQEFVNNSLLAVDPTILLRILFKISPKERLTHYLIRFGDGYASIICPGWSSANIPGFVRLPLVSGYIEVNMVLQPRAITAEMQNMIQPHLPVQPMGMMPPPTSFIDVDLCISLVSMNPLSSSSSEEFAYPTTQQPFPSNIARTSMVFLREHGSFPGCVDSFSIEEADGNNSVLPGTAIMPGAEAAAAIAITTTEETTEAVGTKRKASSKEETDPTKTKVKSAKKKKKDDTSKTTDDDGGAKKPAAKDGKGGAAAAAASKKKSPPEESSDAELKAPSAAAGNKMIQLWKEDEAKKLKKSSSAKTDTASASIPVVISSKKTTKISPKKDEGKSNATAVAASATKVSAAAVREEAGKDRAPSADLGNDMIRKYNDSVAKGAAEKGKTPSKESDDSTKSSSSKKAKGSSKKDKAKSDEGKSAKKPSATEGGKSAKKKSAKETGAEGAKVSKKKRKAPTDGESSDAPKSPSKKKAKTSKADESTPLKGDGKKSEAATEGESEKKKPGPKLKDRSNIPAEPVKDFPGGWTLMTIPRSDPNKYDQKYVSPSGIQFRSKKGAKSFIGILDDVKDETKAFAQYEEEEKKAKELRKVEREAKKKKMAESVVV